ncbi:MAG: sugar ABC transporter ATP-binding protein [Spirochaetales bacterium]|nr:sugar ABC transporter ATP-binding protein [Spirochaetales bacterium]
MTENTKVQNTTLNNGNTLLRLEKIHKKFPGVHALKGVEFELKAGEVHALLGENGAGKSTLIKIIAGVYDYEGVYYLNGEKASIYSPIDAMKQGVGVIYQELNLVQDLSIAENIFFGRLPHNSWGGVKWNELYSKTREYLLQVGLKLSPKTKIRMLSIAQQQLVEIAKALSLNAKILIMDEPTSALCSEEIDKLFTLIEKLKEQGAGIIYVSHKLDEIFRISDKVTVLRDGSYISTQKTENLNEKKLITMMVGRELNDLTPKTKAEIGSTVCEVKNLTTHDVKDISFYVREGEIVGFAGLMGAGRTELAYALLGADERLSGEIIIEGKNLPSNSPVKAKKYGIGLIPENRKKDGIFSDLSVKENITIASIDELSSKGRIDGGKELNQVKNMVDKLSIRTPSLKQLINKLSGGNQQKVIVARWLLKNNLKLLIIDEPTRGIDVGAKAEIYSIMNELAHQGLAIVMMSSEMPEIMGMCDRIYVMAAGRITNEFQSGDATQEDVLASCLHTV